MSIREREIPTGETLRQKGFNVVPKDADLMFEWLTTVQKGFSNPLLRIGDDIHPGLELGDVAFESFFLKRMVSKIVYDAHNDRYEIATALIDKESNPPDSPFSLFSGIPGIQIIPSPRIVSSREFGKHGNDHPPQSGLITDFPELEMKIGSQVEQQGYKAKSNSEGIVVVKNGNDFEERTHEHSFHLHEIREMMGNLCFHMSSDVDEDPKVFQEKYERYAAFLKLTVDLLSESNRVGVANKVLTLAVPRTTKERTEQMQAATKARRRILSMQGIMGDDAEFEDEIKDKIILKEKPDTTFEDIGGCEVAKEELQVVVSYLKNPELFRSEGAKSPRGVLLYGPPGTGKTLLAEATANAASVPIFIVETGEILNSLWGRTERYIQSIFKKAREMAPVIIFVDELDSLALKRDNSSEVTGRIVNVLSTNMQGLKNRKDDGVVVIGATNRFDALDRALLRGGRFSLRIPVELPEQTARQKIFQISMRLAEELAGGRQLFDPAINIQKLAELTDGFSGADIDEIIRRECIDRAKKRVEGAPVGLTDIGRLMRVIERYELLRLKQSKLGFGPNS